MSDALSRYFAAGRGVSPAARICRYLGAPTWYHLGPRDMISWRLALNWRAESGMLAGLKREGSRSKIDEAILAGLGGV